MQDFNPIKATELMSSSRAKINNNEESLESHFSGTYFPTNNLVEGMYCWRTDLEKMYQLGADLATWSLVYDMSQGYNSVAHANKSDYATKDADGNNISDTYYKNNKLSELKSALFPVGSIYLTMTNTNPSTWLGGEWQQIAGGRVLIGASSSYTAGSTGGSETSKSTGSISSTSVSISGSIGSTTLNINQIPEHSHAMNHYHYTGYQNWGNWGYQLRTSGINVTNYLPVSSSNRPTWNGSGGGDGETSATEFNVITTTALKAYKGTSINTDNAGGTQGHTHSISASSSAHNHTFTGNAQSVMQPYLVVYYWQRVK